MDPDIDGRQALPKHFVLILLDAIKLEQYRASDTEGLPRCVVACEFGHLPLRKAS